MMIIPPSGEVDNENIINNQMAPTFKTRQAVNPSTEEPLWAAPVSTSSDVDQAVAAAKSAFPAWRALSQNERAEYLSKFADAIEANQQSFIELLGKEAGKPPQAGGFEMFLVMSLARETLKLRLQDEVVEKSDDILVEGGYEADYSISERRLCVMCLSESESVPWNFPLTLGVGKLVPALLAGNTFIWKPSPYTPYSALKLAEIAAKVLPPGVFQALSGDEDLGPWLTTHPDVAKVSFTGSTATGKKVMAACASTLKRVTLELGGNDVAIVCDDVEIDSVAAKVAFFSFVHSGQICMNIKRIYVHERIYEKFLAALVTITQQWKVGDLNDKEAFFGPIQNNMQYSKLQDLYSNISKEGWKVALGGDKRYDRKGYFLAPTIIDNPPEMSQIVVEEPFGPIVPVLKWDDEKDVITRANSSEAGLGASVWAKDVERARRLAEQLEAGSIWVNTHFEVAPHMPFGGHKQSGLGMDWGEVGLKGWCNPQAYWIKHSG
ncbi:LOW QUALITY PROTEIN: putative aldehyde dehydrogenase FUS7 [Paramyrothecium foliicola]|nr:LOW QUALITY PROTEIN: putative aldehyde dehydrogenase FUS7 [Paramyrothecium foliicola]